MDTTDQRRARPMSFAVQTGTDPASVRARIDTLAAAIASGAQVVSTDWQGQEFAPA
jgi:hypothetical protein